MSGVTAKGFEGLDINSFCQVMLCNAVDDVVVGKQNKECVAAFTFSKIYSCSFHATARSP